MLSFNYAIIAGSIKKSEGGECDLHNPGDSFGHDYVKIVDLET